MRLYYTVSSEQDAIQTKPSLSLGGYKAVSPLPNGSFGNLFGDISMLTIKNGAQNQYIGLVLRNETAGAVTPNIYFTHPAGCYSLLKVAAVSMVADTDGQYYMEHIPNYNSQPLYATFYEAEGVANQRSLGAIPSGGMIGIWIERIFNVADIKDDQNAIYKVATTDPYLYEEVELAKSDDISITFSY